MPTMPPPMPPPSGRPPGAPPPSAGGSPADRAANAMADTVQAQQQALDATFPKGAPPVSVSEISTLADCAKKAIKALDGPEIPKWAAPKGVREMPMPMEVYRPAMLVLMLAMKTLPPEKAGQFTVAPEDFTSDAGIKKVCGMLAQIASDSKIQKLMHEGADRMASSGGPGATPESAEAEPNPDRGAPPHMEPDEDDVTAM